jgi:hypothetical protein
MIKTNVLLSLYFERWGIDIEIRTEIWFKPNQLVR